MPPATFRTLNPFCKGMRRVVGALVGTAKDKNLAVAGKFAQACAKLRQRDVEHAWNRLYGRFRRMAHIEEEPVLHSAPVAGRHVAAQDVGRNHPREVDGILRTAEGRRVA